MYSVAAKEPALSHKVKNTPFWGKQKPQILVKW